MKNTIKTLCLALMLPAFISCSKSENTILPENEGYIFLANFYDREEQDVLQPETKTTLGVAHRPFVWDDGDMIGISTDYGTAGQFTYAGKDAKGNAKFSGSYQDGKLNIGFYPYSASNTLTKLTLSDFLAYLQIPEEILNQEEKDVLNASELFKYSTEIPSTQKYEEDEVFEGFVPVLAASYDHLLTFHQLCGAMEIVMTVEEQTAIKEIVFESSAPVAGKMDFYGEYHLEDSTGVPILYGDAIMSADATNSITVDCGEGITVDQGTTSFFIMLPPGDYENNSITIKSVSGVDMVLFPDDISISRGSITKTRPLTFMENDEAAYQYLASAYEWMYWQWNDRHDSFGLSSFFVFANSMGDDMIDTLDGYNWFRALSQYSATFADNTACNYYIWYMGTFLAEDANKVIYIVEGSTSFSEAEKKSLLGQAYAIRAYAYFHLTRWYARTYAGHESDMSVPLLTVPKSGTSSNIARATVGEAYNLIKSDIGKSVEFLRDAPARTDKMEIDYYVAQGIRAKVALAMEDWNIARDAASESVLSTSFASASELMGGFNDRSYNNVIWGCDGYLNSGVGSFHSIMDMISDYGYGKIAPRYINPLLYSSMSSGDIRKGWWDETNNLISMKFSFRYLGKQVGDNIWMRHEEMVLIQAEAECRLGNDAKARELLTGMMIIRDPEYATTKSGADMGSLTYPTGSPVDAYQTGSLLEEITIQSRIELWGENQRIHDIKRLRQGFRRTADMGFYPEVLLSEYDTDNPESMAWVFVLPQVAFEDNDLMVQTTK